MIEKRKNLDKLKDQLETMCKAEEIEEHYHGFITTEPDTVKIIKGLIEEKEAELEEELADQPPKHNCKLYFICEDEGHCMHYKKPHLGSNCINLDLDTMTCSSTLARANLCVLELKSMKFSDEQIREMLK